MVNHHLGQSLCIWGNWKGKLHSTNAEWKQESCDHRDWGVRKFYVCYTVEDGKMILVDEWFCKWIVKRLLLGTCFHQTQAGLIGTNWNGTVMSEVLCCESSLCVLRIWNCYQFVMVISYVRCKVKMQYNVIVLYCCISTKFGPTNSIQICYPIQGSDLGTLSFMNLNAYSMIICEF